MIRGYCSGEDMPRPANLPKVPDGPGPGSSDEERTLRTLKDRFWVLKQKATARFEELKMADDGYDSMDAEEERTLRTLKDQVTQFEEVRDLTQREYESVRDQLGAARIALAKVEADHSDVTEQLKQRSEHLEKLSPSYGLRVSQLADCRHDKERLEHALNEIKEIIEGVT
jgi:chromosome segregation ATPase